MKTLLIFINIILPMNSFDNLAKLALDEATLGDYMKVVKNSAKSTVKAATSPLSIAKGVLKAADFFASKSGMQYGGQLGTLANKISDLQALGASEAEKRIMQDLYGKNPEKGNPINVELTKDISAPKSIIKDTKPGPGNDTTAYTIDLIPKNSSIDQIVFTKGNNDYGTTSVKLSFYKDGKLVGSRNIPGLKDSGGIHFNGTGKPWTLNLDASDSIDFTDVKAMIAASPDLKLSTDQQHQILAAKNYPEIQKVVREAGKENLYMKAYANAVSSLKRGQEPPTIAPATNQQQEPTQVAAANQQNLTTGINARTPEGNPVTGQTRFTTADKKKTYLYGKGGWKQIDPNTKKLGPPVQQQAQITTAWQKSQNITPTAKPAAAVAPSKKATRSATQTKAGVPAEQPTAADIASMNLPPHPVTSRTPPNRPR